MILFADNFREYASVSQLLDGMYIQAGPNSGGSDIALTTDPDPSAGGVQVLRLPKPADGSNPAVWDRLRTSLPAANATVGAAFRIYIAGMPTADTKGWYIMFKDVNNSVQVMANVQTTGGIKFYRGGTFSNVLGSTSVPVLVANAWNHVEIKVTVSDSVGEIKLYVNGVPKLTLTGIDTKETAETTIAQIEHTIGQSDFTGGGYTYLKDLVYWDSTGTQNNDVLGDVSVITLKPTGDDTLTWTPSTGSTGYALIDELPASDTDYIWTATTGASVFTLEDLPPEYVAVRALVPVIRMNKNDGGVANVQTGLVSGAAEDTGADHPATTAPTFWYDVSELNPATASAWTPTAVNAAKLRLNRTL